MPTRPGWTVEDQADELAFVMSRNQSMRTRLEVSGDQPVKQIVYESGNIPAGHRRGPSQQQRRRTRQDPPAVPQTRRTLDVTLHSTQTQPPGKTFCHLRLACLPAAPPPTAARGPDVVGHVRCWPGRDLGGNPGLPGTEIVSHWLG
jgi:hypothetical protein